MIEWIRENVSLPTAGTFRQVTTIDEKTSHYGVYDDDLKLDRYIDILWGTILFLAIALIVSWIWFLAW